MRNFSHALGASLLFTTLALTAHAGSPGFADLHNHMMAELAFGGGWMHGSASGPESVAMKSCSGNADFLGLKRDHARTKIPILNEMIGKIDGTSGDTGWHLAKRGGYPNYSGWPRWDTIAHQQMWEGFLKKAHEDGLSLMMMSAMNFKPLCLLMPEANREYGCEDGDAVENQINAFKQFVQKRDWLEIALSPTHARDIIRRGKLAVVLAVEITDLFPKGDWRPQLQDYYLKGIRSVQIGHQYNNRFTGVATHNKIFQFLAKMGPILGVPGSHFDLDSDDHNLLGLTAEGEALVSEMMRMGMIVDLAHVSERAIKQMGEISKAHDHYPLIMSHGHFRDVMLGDQAHFEKAAPDWIIELVRDTGGVFGLRTGSEPTRTFGKVPNDCAGSTKSFAQAYQYGAQKVGVKIAFGTDFNGFIQQLRPRFGDDKETCGAETNSTARKKQQQAQQQRLKESFDESGFGHIGQIASVIRELKNFGVDTSNIESSTESFLKSWEKSESRSGQTAIRRLASDPQ